MPECSNHRRPLLFYGQGLTAATRALPPPPAKGLISGIDHYLQLPLSSTIKHLGLK